MNHFLFRTTSRVFDIKERETIEIVVNSIQVPPIEWQRAVVRQ